MIHYDLAGRPVICQHHHASKIEFRAGAPKRPRCLAPATVETTRPGASFPGMYCDQHATTDVTLPTTGNE